MVILRVRRDGVQAVHFLPGSSMPFAVDAEVEVSVDWERRFDHMTQHSGQHLITAIADKTLGAPTTSWNLGWKQLLRLLLHISHAYAIYMLFSRYALNWILQ